MKFNHLSVGNGLSNNVVNVVIQDRTGFIWFGTEDGLNRYDGYNFKIFRHDPSDSNSLSDNNIWSLTEDRNGNIWIGTKGGNLDKFNPINEKFYSLEVKTDQNNKNSITSLYEDSKGNLWIGSYKDGLYKLNPESLEIDNWQSEKNDLNSLSHNYVCSINEDDNGNILIATYDGFNIFTPDVSSSKFQRFYFQSNQKNSIVDNIIWKVTKSKFYKNTIWIGTSNNLVRFNTIDNSFEKIIIANPKKFQYGNGSGSVIEEVVDGEKIIWTDSYAGLIRINLDKSETMRFTHEEDESNSIINNNINNIIKDRSGVIWAATENGVSYTTPKSTRFNYQNLNNATLNLLSFFKKKNVTAITKSKNGLIWIGTNNGLYSVDNLIYSAKIEKILELDNTHIWALTSSHENEIWIGTFGKGLKQFNNKKKIVINWDISHPSVRTNSLFYNRTLLFDSQKNIWVGYWGVGASRINPKNGKSEVWMNDPDNPSSISHNDVWVIKEDRLGRIWIGTLGGGLNLFKDKNGGTFEHWMYEGSDYKGLSSSNIYTICESKIDENSIDASQTVLWLGTSNGLNKFIINNDINENNDKSIVDIASYTVMDGLRDNTISSIVEDKKGNLWLGTSTGISFFEVNRETFENYSQADGINGNSMNPESTFFDDSGLILSGSTEGLNIYDPKSITNSSFQPPVVITNFQIFNKSVNIGKNSTLKNSIVHTDELILEHDQNVFSFEFTALDYNSTEAIQYLYKMEGFDKDWIESGTRRFVTYTNLDAGEYLFEVKSTNADKIWNQNAASLKVIIKPPWWKTLWAYGTYILLIILGLITIRRFEINRTKLRSELKMHEFEIKKKSELEEMKSRFFANLSHEFRTPLMLIKGPLKQLKLRGNNGDHLENIELIERNSDRLKELIDQLLELSQLEASTIPLKAKRVNIITTLKGLISSFNQLAGEKSLSLKFKSELDPEIVWVDIDKFEKIIINLISNAIKFTPNGGSILVQVREILKDEKQYAEIEISDSGISIPKEKLEKIFDRFYQVDDSNHRAYKGSGIGLALVKEFVDLHKWEISVDSEEGIGTTFNLQIPMWENYLTEDEKVQAELVNNMKSADSIIKVEKQNIQQDVEIIEKLELNKNDKNHSILIVDDSEDIRKYLSGILKNEYSIYTAANGEEGIKSAIELIPDLILSDVMMPLMDGIEFCAKIKTDWQTSDIPVVLLTAKASFESKLEGLENGADAYLTKPCDSRELTAVLKNLIEKRERLRSKFSENFDLFNKGNELTTADDDFINKAYEIIEKNLDKTNFSTEHLAKELFVSRTQLHRKILSISGQTPGVLIRTVKLKRAAKLLMEKRFSVTQISYEIGFSSPSQFTRAFTKQFNCPPSAFPSLHKS